LVENGEYRRRGETQYIYTPLIPVILEIWLMAPGVDVRSTYPEDRYARMSGTSVAAPFVTAGIALLWSILPNRNAASVVYSVINASSSKRRSILPPMFNAEAALKMLEKGIR
jgi:subtilase family protein